MKHLLILFIGLWTVACLTLAVLVVLAVLQQWRAEAFPTVVGAVLTSERVEVQRLTERRGPYVSYDVQLRYRYHLDGREYVGRWLRFAGWGQRDLDEAQAQRLVEQYPAGGEVTVHYDPLYPAWALLDPGVRNLDRQRLAFTVPFFLALALIWKLVLTTTWRGFLWPATGGVRVRSVGTQIRITDPGRAGPIDAMLLVATFGSLGVLLVAILVLDLNFTAEQWPWLGIAVAATATGGLLGWGVRRWRTPCETIISLADGTIEVPCDRQAVGLRTKRGPATLRFDRLLDVNMNGQAGHAGAACQLWPYSPTLHLRLADGSERPLRLCTLWHQHRAEMLVQWLRMHLPLDGQPQREVP